VAVCQTLQLVRIIFPSYFTFEHLEIDVMPSGQRDLWPDDIQVEDVLTPLELMDFQAGRLRELTNGILEAAINSDTEQGRTTHLFEIVALELQGYRYRLFRVHHSDSMPYPVRVFAACFATSEFQPQPLSKDAATQLEFEKLLENVLGSPESKSVIQSLIPRTSAERKKLRSQTSGETE
jgi:hypothetical protein